MHFLGLTGAATSFRTETVAQLHEPYDANEAMPYACGWGVFPRPDGSTRHWHNGSAGSFYASLTVLPKENLVVAVVMNRAAGSADLLIEKAIAAILEREAAD